MTTTQSEKARGNGVRVWRSRVLWLMGIWTASVCVTVGAVEILRLAMQAAGLVTH
ncbi:MAG TPA: DUF2474 domain-containing protein [Paraburkholderia sp.]|uniref:DUF2474 domain-containing protein n=1 Tax=Paraburkholderia sp. TaxID=1926495 RepID=UPI002B48AC35|nr:DUF2474 domain-containing protein [Paraburkholderia sp.]HKR43919.1 DUF2474 domain-containing protein [Paraburkholderia sp.]